MPLVVRPRASSLDRHRVRGLTGASLRRRGVIGIAALLAALSVAWGGGDDEAGSQATPSRSLGLTAEDIQSVEA